MLYGKKINLYWSRMWISAVLAVATTAAAVEGTPVTPFRLTDVRLLPGPFQHAQDLDLAYILALDPDRLLAPFRREAGLPEKAKPYGDWESGGLDGHIGGHYLSALAIMGEATGNSECQRRLKIMVAELAACQQANGDGYVGGIPGSKIFWSEFVSSTDPGQKIKSKWVPWYNLHKTFAGLRDAWILTGNAQAKEVLLHLCDWAVMITRNLTPDQWEAMLDTEYGGMNDVLAEVGALTGKAAYLDLAKKFSHRWLLESLAAGTDALDGKHANTQIPKVVGYERLAQATGEARYHAAAHFFWDTVVQHRSVVIGGNSVSEHFHAVDDFTSMIEHREGPETCNTYNMIKLSELLYEHSGDERYVGFCERALFNHILASQNPISGGLVYFTPMRPEHYRVYSQVQSCMWCCVGTGIENHGKYGALIYAHSGAKDLYINQFIASTLTWKEAHVSLRQETSFPDVERTRLSLHTPTPVAFTLKLRHPSWITANDFIITINGQPQRLASQPGSYASIPRTWADGDVIEIALPMRTTVEPLPAKPDYVALMRGPIVLAAAIGNDRHNGLYADNSSNNYFPNGSLVPLDQTPLLVGSREDLVAAVTPVQGKPLTFTAPSVILPEACKNLLLTPFFRIHNSRYVIYWRHASTVAAGALLNQQTHEAEAAALALDRITLDHLKAGEQQPETDHHFQGEQSKTGTFRDASYRDATGWFSYDLKAATGKPVTLAVTTWGGDGRTYDISVNGTLIDSVHGEGKNERFITTKWPLPSTLIATANGTYTVTFKATNQSIAGGVFEVRLLQPDLGIPRSE